MPIEEPNKAWPAVGAPPTMVAARTQLREGSRGAYLGRGEMEKRGQEGAGSQEALCRLVRRQPPPEAGLQGTGLLSPRGLARSWPQGHTATFLSGADQGGTDKPCGLLRLPGAELDQVGASHQGKHQTRVETAGLEIPLSFL